MSIRLKHHFRLLGPRLTALAQRFLPLTETEQTAVFWLLFLFVLGLILYAWHVRAPVDFLGLFT